MRLRPSDSVFSADRISEVRSRVLEAVQAASSLAGIKRLQHALAPESRHPVRVLELWPSDSSAFDASDLLVIQLMGHAISLDTCLAIAGDDGPHVRSIARHLRAVPTDRSACMADANKLLAMDLLWSALFEALRSGGADQSDAEAAAHLLCARKAPRLLPASTRIVDVVVDADDDRRLAWQLHRELDEDPKSEQRSGRW